MRTILLSLLTIVCFVTSFFSFGSPSARFTASADSLELTQRIETIDLGGTLDSDSYEVVHFNFNYPVNYQTTNLKTACSAKFVNVPHETITVCPVFHSATFSVDNLYLGVNGVSVSSSVQWTKGYSLNGDFTFALETRDSFYQGQHVEARFDLYLIYGNVPDFYDTYRLKNVAEAYNAGYLANSKNIGFFNNISSVSVRSRSSSTSQTTNIPSDYWNITSNDATFRRAASMVDSETIFDLAYMRVYFNNGFIPTQFPINGIGESDFFLGGGNIYFENGKSIAFTWSDYSDSLIVGYYSMVYDLPYELIGKKCTSIDFYIANVDMLNFTLYMRDNYYYQGFEAGRLTGYNNGYEDGKSDTYDTAYNKGYNVGFGAGQQSKTSFFTLVSAVFDAPLSVLRSFLNFEIFGYNLSSLFFSLISIALIICIIRLFSKIGKE